MAVTRIEIGGSEVGIVDLRECFHEVRSQGLENDREVMDALFEKVRARNYVPAGMEGAYREGLLAEYRVFTGEAERRVSGGPYLKVRLYGSSCFNCERLDDMVKDALARAGIRADYLHVTDPGETMRAGIISTPALTVNGRTVLSARLPEEKELEDLLASFLDRAPE